MSTSLMMTLVVNYENMQPWVDDDEEVQAVVRYAVSVEHRAVEAVQEVLNRLELRKARMRPDELLDAIRYADRWARHPGEPIGEVITETQDVGMLPSLEEVVRRQKAGEFKPPVDGVKKGRR